MSGQSPVVDVTSTSASVAFTKEMLESVPRGRDLQNVLAMAPGVTQATLDVGGSTLAQRQDTASYGMAAQPKLQYEGHSAVECARDEEGTTWLYDSVHEAIVERLELKVDDVARAVKSANDLKTYLRQRL